MENNILKKNDNTIRKRAATRAALLSMALNVLLGAGKIACGVIYGAISVVADGFNNLSDCGGNIITLIGVKASSMPADKEHPFGHARGEYVASMALAFLIIILGFELFSQSVESIIGGEQAQFSIIAVVVLSVSIFVKLFMFGFNRYLGKKYSSSVLIATSTDSLCDAFASLAVLVSLIILRFTSFSPDGYVSCLVAAFIFISGIKVLCGAISEQLGKRANPAITDEIRRRLLSYNGVYGVHALTIHDYVNRLYASVHIEVDADVPFLAAHELADKIEQDFADSTDVLLTIHLDPVVMSDPETLKLRSLIEAMIEDRYTLHDFRMVRSSPIRLIFEVGVPYDESQSDDKIKSAVVDRLHAEFGCKYEYYVSIQRETAG